MIQSYFLDHNRVNFRRFQIQKQPMMFQHSVAEHLPQDIATELRQRGFNEQPGIGFAALIREI